MRNTVTVRTTVGFARHRVQAVAVTSDVAVIWAVGDAFPFRTHHIDARAVFTVCAAALLGIQAGVVIKRVAVFTVDDPTFLVFIALGNVPSSIAFLGQAVQVVCTAMLVRIEFANQTLFATVFVFVVMRIGRTLIGAVKHTAVVDIAFGIVFGTKPFAQITVVFGAFIFDAFPVVCDNIFRIAGIAAFKDCRILEGTAVGECSTEYDEDFDMMICTHRLITGR